MRISKPTYDTQKNVYCCAISDGFRCATSREGNTFLPSLDTFLPASRDELVATVIETTKGWFSKPLTQPWLKERLEFLFPEWTDGDFEGNVSYEAKQLIISKEKFIFSFHICEKKEFDKILIEFPEEDKPDSQTIVARRAELKEKVKRERARAGRALFRAESLTQQYASLYGETDWETSDEETE
jgi:hypothetical protein